MAARPKLETIAIAALYKLYYQAQHGAERISTEDMSKLFSGNVKPPVAKLAFEELAIQGFASHNTLRGWAQINRPGFTWIETELDSANSFVSKYAANGDSWLFESAAPLEAPTPDAAQEQPTASKDAWEPLPLDRQNPALGPAITRIEELAEAVAQDNGYAANEPDERAYILSALREGVRALREQSVIYRMQFKAFIWEPVERLATRFGPSAIGLLATAAKELIKEGLKHAAKAWWNY